jgi:zinc protease
MSTLADRGLSPVRDVLANGATVTVKESHVTPAVTISAAFEAGSVYDPPDLGGLAHLLARVIDRGTNRLDADAIAEELDNRGVTLHVAVTRHLVTLACTCLSEDFDAVLSLVAEIAGTPAFPQEEIVKRRLELLTALRQDEDNPAVRAGETLMELLYGLDHPYGRRARGTPTSLEAVTREDLVAFHLDRFRPSTLSLVIVGDLDASAAMRTASRAFGNGSSDPDNGDRLRPPRPSTADRRIKINPMMNKAQADIAYGFVTIARTDPAYHAFYVMNNVLGQYSLGGRLGDSIRERQGMAYYAFSAFDANVAEGPLVIRAGVSPDNVERAVASIDEEVDRMGRDGVTAKELADSKQYLTGSIPRTLETNAGIASFLQIVEQFDLGLDYDLRLPDLIAAVTLDEVNAAAHSVMSSRRAAVAIAGPYSASATQERVG